ncbi:MAG: tetraacyldisaccharide 4'-kinase [Muribaculaceae bacterium]|nr:tetraacyldisaccharide 4'-kinase [Muribaculaceae bacterium]
MRTTKDKIILGLLTPASWIYGAVAGLRNWMFEQKFLKSVEYDIPVIGVGNLTVGGSGKTPHVEYIVSRLSTDLNVAVLSRGYKRKTKGFVLANAKSTPQTIGDEPYQIYQKFHGKVKVAACESRRKGIEELQRLFPRLDVIVLDDSFQHRWVKPKISILLTDYSRPFYKDKVLPLGRLRESPRQVNRADMVIVTKCPENLQPLDFRMASKYLDLMSFQKLFFSRYDYGQLMPVFADDAPYTVALHDLTANDSVMLLTGIAHPRYLIRHVRQYPFRVKVDHYPDHHDFSKHDIMDIKKKFEKMGGQHKIILTTEKDAVRLMHNPYFPKELKPFTFYLPVNVRMMKGVDDHDLIEEIKADISRRDVLKS